MKRHIVLILGLVISFATAQSSLAATTVLTFDEYVDGTALTNQYQTVGVTASGATISNAVNTPWPANSGIYVAQALSGLMTFTLNSTIIGDIQSVSAYVSGVASIGIYAYDAGGVLVGQSLTPGATNNMLLSVTSSGNPIASVAIHNGGSSFAIDTLSFVSAPPVLTCTSVNQQLYDSAAALPDSAFRFPASASRTRNSLLKKISVFANHRAAGASKNQLLNDLSDIRDIVKDCVKPSASQTFLLNLIYQLAMMIKAGQC